MEGMFLAEIPKMLLLLLSQGVEQLAPALAPAFAHSENSSLSAFKSQVFQEEAVLSIHTPGLGDRALRQKQVAVKQTRLTSWLRFCPLARLLGSTCTSAHLFIYSES